MKSSHLIQGQQVRITAGRWEGCRATIVDPQTLPDGQPHARCCTVEVLGVNPDGTGVIDYVLPRYMERILHDIEVTTAAPAVPAAALVVEQTSTSTITDPMDDLLDQYRPHRSVLDRYISRSIGGMRDIDLFLRKRQMRDADGYITPMGLVGETQAGKTMFVRALAVAAAIEEGLPKPLPVFEVLGSSGVSTYDLFGMPAPSPDGRDLLVWMEGIVPMAAACGGLLYLDEVFSIASSQITALHGLLDERRSFNNTQRAVPNGRGGFAPEVVKAHKDLWVIATVNPVGYKGVQSAPEAFVNRFDWMIWDYDQAVEERLVPSATIRLLGEALRTARSTSRVISTPVGTSALQRLNLNVATFGATVGLEMFMGLFGLNEREKVRAIIEDRNILDVLNAEYPVPTTPSSI